MTHIALGWIVGLVLLAGCSDSDRDTPDAVASSAVPQASAQTPQPPAPKPAARGVAARRQGCRRQPVNVDAATKQFLDRIQAYVDFHNGVEKTVPALRETPKPEEIAAREKALATP